MTSSHQLDRYKYTQDKDHDVKLLFMLCIKCIKKEHTEAVLLVDAANAFNSVNRKVFLHNVVCPSISIFIQKNDPADPADPAAMPIYALSAYHSY